MFNGRGGGGAKTKNIKQTKKTTNDYKPYLVGRWRRMGGGGGGGRGIKLKFKTQNQTNK